MKEWSTGICDYCGKEKPVFEAPDPFLAEIYPEDDNPEVWWCEDCYDERQGNI